MNQIGPSIGAIGGLGGGVQGAGGGAQGGGGGEIKQLFQQAQQLAPNNQAVQADLEAIHQARAEMQAQEGQGAQAGAMGQVGGMGRDGAAFSPQAQGISAAGPRGMNPQQREQMHEAMAPYIQKLAADVQAAQQQGGATGAPQQPQMMGM